MFCYTSIDGSSTLGRPISTEVGGIASVSGPPRLEVCSLRVGFESERGIARAVDGVSLEIHDKKTVALVGESGCGKSVTALAITRLLPQPPAVISGGGVLYRDTSDSPPLDLLTLANRDMPKIRGGKIAMVFQDPLESLNPVYTVGEQIVEAIQLHRPLKGRAAKAEAVDLLGAVGIASPKLRAQSYPHQLSGGMRQRVMIAMAMACQPRILIADEPTTALDVTVQAQIIDLLLSLQQETGMGMLLITHDLGVVAQAADYVYVMYAGKIVEHAPVGMLFANPCHPYTRGLMRSVPRLDTKPSQLYAIPGQVPPIHDLPSGCRFHPRCELSASRANEGDREVLAADHSTADTVLKRCVVESNDEPSGEPKLRETHPQHFVACWEV